MPSAKSMRYAHSDGITDVCFDDSGRYILTCGSDGDVRIWNGIEDDDAISHRCGDRAFAIASKDNRYFTATDTNTIQAYTFPDGSPDGILTRFTAPANHIILNKSGLVLIAGASDFTIKIVDVGNCSYKTCQGHEAPVLSVSLDPKEVFIASSSCDGTVRIWKMSDRTQVHSMSLIPKCSDVSFSKTLCRMCWESEGKVIYVPVLKEIHCYERSSWKKLDSMSDPSFTEHVSVVTLSPDGKYLAAGGSDGVICVFDVQSTKCVDKHRNEKGLSITALAWNPKNNRELAFCDNQGQLGMLCDIGTDSKQVDDGDGSKMVSGGVFDETDDDFLIQATNDDNSADSDVDIDSHLKPSHIFSDDDDDNQQGPKISEDDASSVVFDVSKPSKPSVHIEGYKPTPLQRAFQPGSTPEHLTSRFMVWNSVGIVRMYTGDDENSIDIEFHDTSIHHAMHIENSFNYTMADMSTEAVLLASEGDSETPSKLMCLHFSSWDNNKEWSITMPDNEQIESVALGEGWLAVATEARNVRLFSLAGVQKELFTLPGPVVCTSAHSSQLMVVYHRGTGIPGEQCLGVILLDVQAWKRELYGEPLPLSVKEILCWLGFSAEGTPFYMDSAGIVRMLNRQACKTWVQVANTKQHAKGKSDHYWVVGINENPQQIRCIPCKGARYPTTLPRPAPVVLPFQVPMCELSTEKSQYEELLWRTNVLSGHFDHWTRQGFDFDPSLKPESLKPAQEALMKLFALSARSDREFRALEVCEMMSDQHTLQLAIKYSSRMRFMQLAQKISEMAARKAEEDEAKLYSEDYERQSHSYSGSLVNVGQFNHGAVDQNIEEHDGHVTNVEMEEVDEDRHSGPMLAIKSKEKVEKINFHPFKTRSNPFKVSTSPAVFGSTKGTQVFDSLSNKREKPSPTLITASRAAALNLHHKKEVQPKLFLKKKTDPKATKSISTPAPVQKASTAFDLWLDENMVGLREQQPNTEEEDFIKTAAEKFRELSKEERQLWLKKSKELAEKSKENNAEITSHDDADNKKRKREDDDDDLVKKPLSQSANSKLANFSFSKEES